MSDAAENLESVDAMVEQAMSPETPMEVTREGEQAKPPSALEEAPKAAEEKEAPTEQEAALRTLNYKGKELQLDDHKYQMYAQKGLDYEQKMHQLRVDRKMWEQERAKETSSIEELKQINEYAKANPEFERLIQREWARIQGGGTPSEQINSGEVPLAQQSQLNSILERLDLQDQQLKQRATAEREAKIEGAIESYKEHHSDFDWNTKDELGQTLEDKITQHAVDNEIKDFKTAANDYLFDEHLKRAQLKSKEQAAKEIQKQNKLGLGKVTKESQLQIKKSDGVRGKSYNDLATEALAELGLR